MEGLVNSPLFKFDVTPTFADMKMNNNDSSCGHSSQPQVPLNNNFLDFDLSPLLATELLSNQAFGSFVSNTMSDDRTFTDLLDASVFTYDNALVLSPLFTPPVDAKQEKPATLIERPVPSLTLPNKVTNRQQVSSMPLSESNLVMKGVQKRAACQLVPAVVENSSSSSSWKIVTIDRNIVKDDGSTRITIGSRKCSFVTEQVEPQLYSCISYDMKHEAFGSFVDDLAANQRVILVRVEVIDAKTKQEVRKNNTTILSSNPVGVLTKDVNGNYHSDMKVKFNSCSYHFDRALFQFRVSYSFQNSEVPFLIKESSEFLIFARKASTSTTKKRKRSGDEDLSEEQSSKRLKSSGNTPSMSQALTSFSNNLSSLFACLDNLNQSERKQAFSLLANQVESCQDFPKSLLLSQ